MSAEQGWVQFQPDEKQEKDDPDLTEDIEVLDAFPADSPGKNRQPYVREEPAQKAWPEQNTGDHFPHHLGLMKPREDPPGDPAERHDQSDLQKQSQKDIAVHREFSRGNRPAVKSIRAGGFCKTHELPRR